MSAYEAMADCLDRGSRAPILGARIGVEDGSWEVNELCGTGGHLRMKMMQDADCAMM